MNRPVPEKLNMGFVFYGHEVLQVGVPDSQFRQVVEVASSSSQRLKHRYLKYLQSAMRLHILTTVKIYQLNTYNKVNLFICKVTVYVIATTFRELYFLNTPQNRICPL